MNENGMDCIVEDLRISYINLYQDSYKFSEVGCLKFLLHFYPEKYKINSYRSWVGYCPKKS